MNKRIKKKQIKMKNKRLCKRYPFLIPTTRWTGKASWDKKKRKHMTWYNAPYSYTELDLMPEGWRKVFGEQICEEIREALIKVNYLYDYRISDIKEKYGSLRWYDFGATEEIYDIIRKYEKMSEHICLHCGRPAEIISFYGWLEPLCEKCQKKFERR